MEILAHPHKKNGGEDAAFICTDANTVGVADGVGGWAEKGIDAGAYARNLMDNAKQLATALKSAADEKSIPLDALRVLVGAHRVTRDPGSATACVAVFEGSTMRATNIGDSGFAIIRQRELCFKSPPQQHSFNFPYQIGFGSDADHPAMADRFEVELRSGDVVIMATDGLFDNVFDKQLCHMVSEAQDKGLTPQQTASNLASFAQRLGMTAVVRSPFSVAAANAGYLFMGGKLDDTSVVVTYVSEPSEDSDNLSEPSSASSEPKKPPSSEPTEASLRNPEDAAPGAEEEARWGSEIRRNRLCHRPF
mmetsp:Transcript_27452/g.53459  ORF Transcript_27452/g.53459 Transcript_27452/m.53459 type:complete len:306 (-) Transcript_27452:63-980(-)